MYRLYRHSIVEAISTLSMPLSKVGVSSAAKLEIKYVKRIAILVKAKVCMDVSMDVCCSITQ